MNYSFINKAICPVSPAVQKQYVIPASLAPFPMGIGGFAPYLTLLVPVAILIIFVAASLLAGRQMLKCPECGNVFRSPRVETKRSGLGWTLPYMGKIKCPKCGESRGRRDYQKAPRTSPTAT
jgi:uncharacterized C2H2 Zn-finger protein